MHGVAEVAHGGLRRVAVGRGAQRHLDPHPAVDSGERLGQVGLGRGRSRQLSGGSGHLGGGPPHVVERGGRLVAEARPKLDDPLQRLAVAGRDRRGRLPRDSRPARQRGERTRGVVPLLLADRATAALGGPDHDQRQCLLAAERALRVDDPRGFGAPRQEGRLVVGGDLTELSGVGAEHRGAGIVTRSRRPRSDDRRGSVPTVGRATTAGRSERPGGERPGGRRRCRGRRGRCRTCGGRRAGRPARGRR